MAVATDSSACLPVDLAAAWGVAVAPLKVTIDDVSYDEGSGIASSDVVAALVAGRKVTTSQPGPAALAALVDDAVAAGASHLVFVCLSGEMSGTAQAMRAVAADAALPVTVVDTATVSLSAGFAALSAAAVARAGASADAVAAEAMRVAASSLCLFTVDTLEYLRRGGRIGATAAAIGGALGVRPVLGVAAGRIQQVERARTSTRARVSLLEAIAHHAATLRHPLVGTMTLPGDDDIAGLAHSFLGTRGQWPTVTAGLSAALAAHGGPGSLVAVAADVHPDVVAHVASLRA